MTGSLAAVNSMAQMAVAVSAGMAQMAQAVSIGMVQVSTNVQIGMAQATAITSQGMVLIVTVTRNGITTMVAAFQAGGTQAVAIAQSTASGIQAAFVGVDLYSAGMNMMQGLVNGINSMRGTVEAAAQSIAQSAANAVNSALQIHSPSRLMIQSGQYTGEGMAIGMENMSGRVQNAANVALAQPVQDVSGNLMDLTAPEVPARSSVIGETIDRLSGTGRKNGIADTDTTDTSPTFVFSPTYNLGNGISKDDVVDANKISMAEFDQMMRRWQKKNARISFA